VNDEERAIKIAYVTAFEPRDRQGWSGTIYYIAQTLQKHIGEVTYLGPRGTFHEKLIGMALRRTLKFLNKRDSLFAEEGLVYKKLVGIALHRSSKLLLKKKFVYEESYLIATRYASVGAQKLAEQAFDLIVAPAGVRAVCFLETNIPIILVGDSTYPLLLDYYPEFKNVLKRSVREMHSIEDLALKKASAIIYSSAWAAQSAIEDYHIDPRKVHVVPFGANLEHPPAEELVLQRKKSGRCTLFFLGVSWQRKGGDIAFETLLELEEMGISAELIVCGCTPPKEFSHERMKVIPFLNKNDVRQRNELDRLFMLSDFLLLPTRGDCLPVVFCEAAAFGLPVITTSTGGVAEAVIDGENGFLLPLDARGDAYAEVIARTYRDDERYNELVRASRAAFDTRLNWDVWGVAVKKILAELLDRPISCR